MKKSLAFLVAGMVGAGVIAAVANWLRPFERVSAKPAALAKPVNQGPMTAVATEEKRKIYPYSIVPGGALTVAEARRAMSDPAVRDHYAGVDLTKLKQVALTAGISGYVSYRFGDKIYWTSNQVHLKAGEKVFTDGQHIVRGRCLNCYSAHPMMPIRPREPTEAIMDTSIEVPVIAFSFPHMPLEPSPVAPPEAEMAIAKAGGSTARAAGGGRFIPIIPFIPPLHRHKTTPPPPPPVTVIPEPQWDFAIPGALVVILVGARSWQRVRQRRAMNPGG